MYKIIHTLAFIVRKYDVISSFNVLLRNLEMVEDFETFRCDCIALKSFK